MKVLLGRFTGSAGSHARKQHAWAKVAEAISAVGGCERTPEEIKKNGEITGEHSDVKKKAADLKRQANKTGDGPARSGLTPLEERASALLGEVSVTGISDGVDTDSQYNLQENDLFTTAQLTQSSSSSKLTQPSSSSSTTTTTSQPSFSSSTTTRTPLGLSRLSNELLSNNSGLRPKRPICEIDNDENTESSFEQGEVLEPGQFLEELQKDERSSDRPVSLKKKKEDKGYIPSLMELEKKKFEIEEQMLVCQYQQNEALGKIAKSLTDIATNLQQLTQTQLAHNSLYSLNI
ncbi:unnamed protein product [Didymodactylos carnosus]|uniref:Uncharacterized protein n=1 Tax=Didymodactylos carnosus TaxID=1234261 RepID=A0A813TEA2_9BILA|nr:unnamed protein product [Didymodactylos carnosus]CAF3596003.1 unnamed protein product [Didymodactylos carnosus]